MAKGKIDYEAIRQSLLQRIPLEARLSSRQLESALANTPGLPRDVDYDAVIGSLVDKGYLAMDTGDRREPYRLITPMRSARAVQT